MNSPIPIEGLLHCRLTASEGTVQEVSLQCSRPLAVSAMFVLLMSGLILFQTSQIVRGGETNYISATVTLFVSIYNLFTSLLHLLGVFGED